MIQFQTLYKVDHRIMGFSAIRTAVAASFGHLYCVQILSCIYITLHSDTRITLFIFFKGKTHSQEVLKFFYFKIGYLLEACKAKLHN